MSAAPLDVSVAIDDYDHVRALASGDITVDGVHLRFHRTSRPAETFHRQLRFQEWDVSELSLAQYCHLVDEGDDRFVGLPVFPSRRFRHSSVFVPGDSPLRAFEELAGRRVGVPEWGQTAGVWVRGTLADRHGIDLTSVTWVQGGAEEPGRPEHALLHPVDGLRIHPVAAEGLAAKLLSGSLDAVIAARFPPRMLASGAVRTLLDDTRAAELAYWRDTGILPIMHLLVMDRRLYQRHRWLAKDLVVAFTAAKEWSLRRLSSPGTPMFPLPHLPELVASTRELFGGDPWPYGLEANRHALDTFCRYAHEQGLTSRRLAADELFPPSAVDEFHG